MDGRTAAKPAVPYTALKAYATIFVASHVYLRLQLLKHGSCIQTKPYMYRTVSLA